MIIFDIGTGSEFLSRFDIADDDYLYCFEPIPELAQKLHSNSANKNILITQKAVCDCDSVVKFNIAGVVDNNLSSLLNLSNNAFNNWPGRNDFIVTKEIKIETIRLDTFIKTIEKPIKKIDYIYLNTNGSDIDVLIGMGEYLNIVEEGSLEACVTPECIYAGQNSFSESIEFLNSNNFSIINVQPIDQYGNLVKIYFKKI